MKNYIPVAWASPSLMIIFLALAIATVKGQEPTPSPSPENRAAPSTQQPAESNHEIAGYEVISSIKIGVRGLSINGSENKYRSDLNYRPGIRAFDSSFLLQAKDGNNGLFDSLLVNTSGWGGDPNGYSRFNVAKSGVYSFDASVRRMKYFNNLVNFALGQHTQNTRHQFGDFDLRLLPDNERLRFNFGFSRDTRRGPGLTSTRFSGDEFGVDVNYETRSNDFRAGVDAKVLGFDLSFLQGARYFRDNTSIFETVTNPGNNVTNNGRIDTLYRELPTRGTHFYSRFSVHRLIARKLDFTGRYIYQSGRSHFTFFEQVTGRASANPGNLINPLTARASGEVRRPSSVGDIGLTLLATDKLRISNTFRYDNFRINGSDSINEVINEFTLAGARVPRTPTNFFFQRTTNYRRFMNTIEADYQFNTRLSVHAGYRFTDRHIELFVLNALATTSQSSEIFDNKTHSAIFGFMARPVKAWTIYFDGEHGNADNVFTRLANNDFTNFRLRNRVKLNGQVHFNASLVTRNNTNASDVISGPAVPAGTAPEALDVRIRTRNFSSSVDWTPSARVSLSSGYTRLQITSLAGILLPISGRRQVGESHYFLRDNFFFFNVFAQPTSRLSFYAGYRINRDTGQGDRVPPSNTILIDSYPMSFQSPEARMTLWLNRMVDWNVGYQYFNYRDRFFPVQSYRAHLPYTSLRIFFGRRE